MLLNVQSKFLANYQLYTLIKSYLIGNLINGIHEFKVIPSYLISKLKFRTRIKNLNTVVICVLPIKSVNQSSDFCLFELCVSVFKEWFFVFCFLLVILVAITITITLMSQDSTNASAETSAETVPSDTISNPFNRNIDLSLKLIRQVIHNQSNPNQRLNYRSFPESHSGHLTIEQRVRLSCILRHSILADRYRFGSSLGTFYTAGTYNCPEVSPEMAGVVLSAELNPN